MSYSFNRDGMLVETVGYGQQTPELAFLHWVSWIVDQNLSADKLIQVFKTALSFL